MVAARPPTADAVVVEDNAASVTYTPAAAWNVNTSDSVYTGASYHLTYAADASCSFVFQGSQVWFYADRNIDHGNFTASIDDGAPQTINGYSAQLETQLVLFTATVSPGTHTLKLINQDNLGGLGVDYFAYIPLEGSSSSSSSLSPTSGSAVNPAGAASTSSASSSTPAQSTPSSQASDGSSSSLPAGASVGIALGCIAVVVFLILGFLIHRDRRKRQIVPVTNAEPWSYYAPLSEPSPTPPPAPSPANMEMFERRPESMYSVEPPYTDSAAARSAAGRLYFQSSTHTPSVAPSRW